MADARGGAAGVAAFPAGEQPAGRAAGLSLGQGSSADSARAAALRGCARRRGGRSGVPAAVAPEGEVEDDVRGGGSARGRGRARGGAEHASGGGQATLADSEGPLPPLGIPDRRPSASCLVR